MIKAICFDLDGVYFTSKGKKSFEQSLTELTQNAEAVKNFLYKSDLMLNFVKGLIKEDEFWDKSRELLKLNLTNEEFIHLWVKDYEIDFNIKKLITNVRELKIKTCTCSNNNPSRIKALEKRFEFLKDFDIKIFSYETGFVKPQKEIFETLIEKAECKPEEIVYSDDNPERLDGAKQLGINTFVYTTRYHFLDELQKLGVDLN